MASIALNERQAASMKATQAPSLSLFLSPSLLCSVYIHSACLISYRLCKAKLRGKAV